MLYIRADGNTDIGMGHVMRCLAVAEAAADRDSLHPPVFITADEGCCSMIGDRGFRVIVLDTDFRDMMSELPRLKQLFQEEPDSDSTVLLVDSYQVSCDYYLELRKLVRVACFEDMGMAYPVDLLINYNIYAPGLERNYAGTGQCPARVLLGAAYMPLRKAFQEPAGYVIREKVTDVIITTGGSDPYFAAAALTDALCGDGVIAGQGIRLHLISGPFNRFAEELKRRYQCGTVREWHGHRIAESVGGSVAVTVHEGVKDMQIGRAHV